MKRTRLLPVAKPWTWRLADWLWRVVFFFRGPK